MNGYSVHSIKREDAIPWIKLKHYARRVPSICHSYGLFFDRVLTGIITFGIPASPQLCSGICGAENRDLVIEFNRLCLENNIKNEASFFVSRALKLLPAGRIVVSYADTGQNHTGYVYQSSNWVYTGITDYNRKPRSDRMSDNKHGRHYKSSAELKYRSQKHRYVYFVGSKKFKKEMLSKLNYSILPYPKGESKKYDASANFAKQVQLF